MTILTGAARRRVADSGQFPTSAPYNVPDYIHIPTYDGSNQAVHPTVIDFANEPNEGDTWNGWRFWMAMTPYPASLAEYEDPSLLVSQDGVHWQVPPGLTNPLYRPTEGPYNNDPDIAYDPDSDELVLLYRDYDVPKMARSTDGITWPETPTTIAATITVSPCILRTSDGVWHLWRGTSHRTASVAEGPYTEIGQRTGLSAYPVWHLDITTAPDGGGFHMIFHDEANELIYAASSADGNAWVPNPTPILIAGTHGWSLDALYKATMSLHEDGDRYRVWYCGRTTTPRVWRIAYTEIPLTEWPAIP